MWNLQLAIPSGRVNSFGASPWDDGTRLQRRQTPAAVGTTVSIAPKPVAPRKGVMGQRVLSSPIPSILLEQQAPCPPSAVLALSHTPGHGLGSLKALSEWFSSPSQEKRNAPKTLNPAGEEHTGGGGSCLSSPWQGGVEWVLPFSPDVRAHLNSCLHAPWHSCLEGACLLWKDSSCTVRLHWWREQHLPMGYSHPDKASVPELICSRWPLSVALLGCFLPLECAAESWSPLSKAPTKTIWIPAPG